MQDKHTIKVEYKHLNDGSWTNITSHVARCTWTRGMRERDVLGHVYPPGNANIQLYNDTGRFSPYNRSSIIKNIPGGIIRISLNGNVKGTYWVESAIPSYEGNNTLPVMDLVCQGSLFRLYNYHRRLSVNLMRDALTGLVLRRVLLSVSWPPSGFPGANDIDGGNSTINSSALQRTGQIGGYKKTGNLEQVLNTIARAEAGVIYEKANGGLKFENRLFRSNTYRNARSSTFTTANLGKTPPNDINTQFRVRSGSLWQPVRRYEMRDSLSSVINSISSRAQQFQSLGQQTLFYRDDGQPLETFTLAPGATKNTRLYTINNANQYDSAWKLLTFTTLTRDTDFTTEPGGGAAFIFATAHETNQDIYYTFRNDSTALNYTVNLNQIRGSVDAIGSNEPISLFNQASIDRYGLKERQYDINLITDVEKTKAALQGILELNHGIPDLHHFVRVSLRAPMKKIVNDLDVSSLVNVYEPENLFINEGFFVEQLHYDYYAGGYLAMDLWLSDASKAGWWVIGRSSFGQDDVLGF